MTRVNSTKNLKVLNLVNERRKSLAHIENNTNLCNNQLLTLNPLNNIFLVNVQFDFDMESLNDEESEKE